MATRNLRSKSLRTRTLGNNLRNDRDWDIQDALPRKRTRKGGAELVSDDDREGISIYHFTHIAMDQH